MAVSRSGEVNTDNGAVNDICVNLVRTHDTCNTAYGSKACAVSVSGDIDSGTAGYYGCTDTAYDTADKVVGVINGNEFLVKISCNFKELERASKKYNPNYNNKRGN